MQGFVNAMSKLKEDLLVLMLSLNNSFNHLAFSYKLIVKTR